MNRRFSPFNDHRHSDDQRSPGGVHSPRDPHHTPAPAERLAGQHLSNARTGAGNQCEGELGEGHALVR
jgi:hypothetical protein